MLNIGLDHVFFECFQKYHNLDQIQELDKNIRFSQKSTTQQKYQMHFYPNQKYLKNMNDNTCT